MPCALLHLLSSVPRVAAWQLIGWRRSSGDWASQAAETAMDVDMRSRGLIAPPPTPSEMLLGVIRRGRSAPRPLDMCVRRKPPFPRLLTTHPSTPVLCAHTRNSSRKSAASSHSPSKSPRTLHKPQSQNARGFAHFEADLAHADFMHQQLALASSLHAEVLRTPRQHVRTHTHTLLSLARVFTVRRASHCCRLHSCILIGDLAAGLQGRVRQETGVR